jgi:hypothetical protein
MKNVFVLPTDKPSRLFRDSFGKLLYSINIDQEQKHFAPQHLYITSDEEINEGNWFYDLDTKYVKIKQSWENSHLNFNGKKIILTTDQDLIKEGVQAIDDEFLEWFVKNPSCEYVEVSEDYFKPSNMVYGHDTEPYKIIIPKEEQKQHLVDMMKSDEELGLYEEPKTKCYCGHTTYCDCGPEQDFKDIELPQQERPETLEEVAERFYGEEEVVNDYDISGYLQSAFLTGAKWQQERSYSEEDIREAFLAGVEKESYKGLNFDDWFEKFKK